MSEVRSATSAAISSASAGVVRRRFAARHCCTAASQPARLKMNVIAGSKPARSSLAITSARRGGTNRGERRCPAAPAERNGLAGTAAWARLAPAVIIAPAVLAVLALSPVPGRVALGDPDQLRVDLGRRLGWSAWPLTGLANMS